MLNKIWAGLIIIGILFAVGQDIYDEVYNTHENGIPQQTPYTIIKPSSEIKSDRLIVLHLDNQSPEYLHNIALANGKKNKLLAQIVSRDKNHLTLLLPELHWNKLRAVTRAAFDIAEFAAKLALGLIGIMSLWLGLMQIAEKSGLIQYLVKWVEPLLHWLFPAIPRHHPAFGSISMNMAANILGLGNAATPLGIKAMQQLQELNPDKNSASDEMCMFLALNTSSVQLLPPVTLIALMGTQISELIVPIILATSCSTITAVMVAKFYARQRKKSCNNSQH